MQHFSLLDINVNKPQGFKLTPTQMFNKIKSFKSQSKLLKNILFESRNKAFVKTISKKNIA
jgi:hypothetical protein